MSKKRWFYFHDNVECGPHTEAEMIALIEAGELEADVLVRREDTDDFVPAYFGVVVKPKAKGTTGRITARVTAVVAKPTPEPEPEPEPAPAPAPARVATAAPAPARVATAAPAPARVATAAPAPARFKAPAPAPETAQAPTPIVEAAELEEAQPEPPRQRAGVPAAAAKAPAPAARGKAPAAAAPAADASAASGRKKWFYYYEGREHGPFTDREIIEKIEGNDLPPTVPVRREDSDDYISAEDVIRKSKSGKKAGEASGKPAAGEASAARSSAPATPAAKPSAIPATGPGSGTGLPRFFQARDSSGGAPAFATAPSETAAPVAPGKFRRRAKWVAIAAVAFVVLAVIGQWALESYQDSKLTEEELAEKEKHLGGSRSLRSKARARARAVQEAKKEAERKAAEEATRKAAEEAARLRRVVQLTKVGTSWTNSLGLRFVPVPHTKVLFCVDETRVQDYAKFVEATKREWFRPTFAQEPTHPAGNMTWEDASAFCRWLTAQERASNHLGPQDEYSLPTDHDWSAAAGLPKEPGEMPADRHLSLRSVYAWGTNWPPPEASGNFYKALSVDQFEFTAPVGSFAPNPFGIHDLSGNVAEWCLDWMNSTRTTRVTRGGSYTDYASDNLHLSFRGAKPPTRRLPDLGFRLTITVADPNAPPPPK